jgi:hypothetical protein
MNTYTRSTFLRSMAYMKEINTPTSTDITRIFIMDVWSKQSNKNINTDNDFNK